MALLLQTLLQVTHALGGRKELHRTLDAHVGQTSYDQGSTMLARRGVRRPNGEESKDFSGAVPIGF